MSELWSDPVNISPHRTAFLLDDWTSERVRIMIDRQSNTSAVTHLFQVAASTIQVIQQHWSDFSSFWFTDISEVRLAVRGQWSCVSQTVYTDVVAAEKKKMRPSLSQDPECLTRPESAEESKQSVQKLSNSQRPPFPLMCNWYWHNDAAQCRTRAWVTAGGAQVSLITLTRTLLHLSVITESQQAQYLQLGHLHYRSCH